MRNVITIGLVVFFLLLGLSVYLLNSSGLRDSLRQSNLDSIRSKAMKHRRNKPGKVINWRTLQIKPRVGLSDPGTVGTILGADFNGDGNEEVLFLPKSGKGVIYTPAGDTITTALNGAMFQPAGTWDFNNDGKAELYRIPFLVNGYSDAFDNGRTFQTEVFSLDGVVLATLDGLAVKNPELVFDYNNDAQAELALLSGAAEFTIYGKNGNVVTRIHHDEASHTDPWLPVIKSLPAPIEQPCGGYCGEDVGGAVNIADVDSNGLVELVTHHGILNLKTGEITRFKYPSGLSPDLDSDLPPTVGDFFGTGFMLVAVPTELIAQDSVGVSIFDATGTLNAYEEIGYSLLGLITINSGSRDYLVAHAPDRILIFP